jgi:hypothetical protein
MDGASYTIGASSFNFNSTPCDASSTNAFSYATHPLACTLSDSIWKGDIDFKYTGRGSGGVAHSLLAVTADTMNAWNTSSFGVSNQNAIEAYIYSPTNGVQSTDSVFAHAKLATAWGTASKGISVSMNTTYYIRLQRINKTTGKISLFTDAARTIHAPGSPKVFSISSSVTGLGYVQHGSIPQGYYTKTLTGTLKNLSICDSIAHTTGINIPANTNNINIYPNPSNGNFIIESNSITKQTVQMYDINGRVVLTQTINGKTAIDASNLTGGVYTISIISDQCIVNRRIIITK